MARPEVLRRARRVFGLPSVAIGAVGGLVGPDARQALVALGLNSSTSLVAGAVLGSLTGTFERYPGLLVLVPAAIGLRGNIFGSLGNRISTSIHAGEFRLTSRPGSVLGQNVLAAAVLTLAMSVLIGAVAAGSSSALGLGATVGVLDLALVSTVGGLLASVPVLGATLGLAAGGVRYGWDLDNVNAPLVTTLGDVLTLPALAAVTGLIGLHVIGDLVAVALVVGAAVTLAVAWRSSLPVLQRVVRESTPVLVVAVVVSIFAGVVLENRLAAFSALPALLVLVPAHLSSAGALGGILTGRLSSKFLLGVSAPTAVPSPAARADLLLITAVGLPVYALNGIGAHYVSLALGIESPGLAELVGASVLGGAIAIAVVLAIAYYGTIAAVRLGLDPDNYGIPLVTSTVDLVGSLTLVFAIAVFGLAAAS